MRIYDLTAVFSTNLPAYGGDSNVVISQDSEISKGHVCNGSTITMSSHTGTHADAPKHFIDDGLTCDNIPLERFFGRAKVYDLRKALDGRKLIEVGDVNRLEINESDIILLNTGSSPLMRKKEFDPGYVSVTPEAAAYLAGKKIKTLGVDYLSVETFGRKGFGAHHALLGGGIALLEGLVFDNSPIGFVPQGEYLLSAMPLKFENGNGSPVRAALMDETSVGAVFWVCGDDSDIFGELSGLSGFLDSRGVICGSKKRAGLADAIDSIGVKSADVFVVTDDLPAIKIAYGRGAKAVYVGDGIIGTVESSRLFAECKNIGEATGLLRFLLDS